MVALLCAPLCCGRSLGGESGPGGSPDAGQEDTSTPGSASASGSTTPLSTGSTPGPTASEDPGTSAEPRSRGDAGNSTNHDAAASSPAAGALAANGSARANMATDGLANEGSTGNSSASTANSGTGNTTTTPQTSRANVTDASTNSTAASSSQASVGNNQTAPSQNGTEANGEEPCSEEEEEISCEIPPNLAEHFENISRGLDPLQHPAVFMFATSYRHVNTSTFDVTPLGENVARHLLEDDVPPCREERPLNGTLEERSLCPWVYRLLYDEFR